MNRTYIDRSLGKTGPKDRKYLKIAAVLILISAALRMLYLLSYSWMDIVNNTDPGYLLYFIVGNTYKDLIWIALGAYLLYRADRIAINKGVGLISWVLAVYVLNIWGVAVGPDPVEYLIEVTAEVLAFGLMVFGTMVWLGRYKYSRALGCIAMFYVAYEVLSYRLDIIMAVQNVMSLTELMYYILPLFPYSLLMLLFAFLVFRPNIMPKSLINHLSQSADRIIDTGYTDEETYMVRADVMRISELLGTEPADTEEAFEFEESYPMIDPLRRRTMTVRRWKGETFLRAAVGSSSGSFDGFRFQIRQIVPDTGSLEDCGSVRMYGEPGMYADIMVRDRELSFQELSELEMKAEKDAFLSR